AHEFRRKRRSNVERQPLAEALLEINRSGQLNLRPARPKRRPADVAIRPAEAIVDLDLVELDFPLCCGGRSPREIDRDQPRRIEAVIRRFVGPERDARLALDPADEPAGSLKDPPHRDPSSSKAIEAATGRT